MCVIHKKRINGILMPLVTVAIVSALSGCDAFSDNWDNEDGKCRSLSGDRRAVVVVSDRSVAFVQPDRECPGNLDLLGSRFTTISINSHRYPATLLCNSNTGNRLVTMAGIPAFVPDVPTENTASVVSASIIKTLTEQSSLRVSIEGENFRFSRGNFARACRAWLPEPPEKPRRTAKVPEEKSPPVTLGDLMKETPEPRPAEGKRLDADRQEKPASPPVVKDTVVTQDLAAPVPSAPALLKPVNEALALDTAKSTWLLSHPGTDLTEFTWDKSMRPSKEINGEVLRVIRFTTTSPLTGLTSDVDVDIQPDGQPGYALSNDRQAPPATTAPAPAPAPQGNARNTYTVSAACTLTNGKHVSVMATDNQPWHYRYTDKNNLPELELREGEAGVKAFHYYSQPGMGAVRYIRFSKGVYDYVVLEKDTGRQEFQGVQVHKNRKLIASQECSTPLNLDTSSLPQNSRVDSDQAGDTFIYN